MRETQLLPFERKYIEVQYNDATQKILRDFCERHGFDLGVRFDKTRQDPADFDFHTTVWYTTTEHQMNNVSQVVDVTAYPRNFTLFGDNQDILVIELDSEDLHAMREEIGAEFEMQDMYPDYRPHITVCYAYQGDAPSDEILGELDTPLVANRLNIKPQKK